MVVFDRTYKRAYINEDYALLYKTAVTWLTIPIKTQRHTTIKQNHLYHINSNYLVRDEALWSRGLCCSLWQIKGANESWTTRSKSNPKSVNLSVSSV